MATIALTSSRGSPATEGAKAMFCSTVIQGNTAKGTVDGYCPAPNEQFVILWDGTNESGQTLAAGVYLLRWESAGKKQTRKLAVVK